MKQNYILYNLYDEDKNFIERILFEVSNKEISINVQWEDYSCYKNSFYTKFKEKNVVFSELSKYVQKIYNQVWK